MNKLDDKNPPKSGSGVPKKDNKIHFAIVIPVPLPSGTDGWKYDLKCLNKICSKLYDKSGEYIEPETLEDLLDMLSKGIRI